MPTERTVVTYTLKELKELHPKGYEKALAKLSEWATEGGHWYEFRIQEWKSYLEDHCGFYKVEIDFSGFWSQGDGACFYGKMRNLRKFMEGFSGSPDVNVVDEEMFNLHLTSQYPKLYRALVEGHEDLIGVSFDLYKNGHFYSHENTVNIEWNDLPDEHSEDEAVRELLELESGITLLKMLRGVMQDMYKRLEECYEDASSVESLTDTAEANKYEFTDKGELF